MGAYKRIEQVPDIHHLSAAQAQLSTMDLWGEFSAPKKESLSEHTWKYGYDKAFREWSAFMGERGRHYACALPEDFEAFSERMVADLTLATAWKSRLAPILYMYEYALENSNYPHLYHPGWMSVYGGGECAAIYAEGNKKHMTRVGLLK